MSKKLTIEFVRKSFEKDGYSLLTDTYKNAITKLTFICPNGHKGSISWDSWRSGHRCAYCAGNNSLSYDSIKDSFESEGYILLSKKYINNTQKLDYVCKNGHTHSIAWRHWVRGVRCPYCAGNVRFSYEHVKDSFESEGYTLLSKKYVNTSTKLEFICPEGHEYSITWANWSKGQRCYYCHGNVALTHVYVKNEFSKEGYNLLSKTYKNAHQKLKYVCPFGHKHTTTWAAWSQGKRCPSCYGNIKHSIDFVRDNIESHGYKLIDTVYNSTHTPLHLICPKGHDYYISWNNWNSKSYRCPRCTNIGTSKQETELVDFIKSIYNGKVISRSKSIIPPLELDIVLPDINLAIEYCGVYWHSELAGKDKKYHLNKLNRCLNKDYKLITIFEDELILKRDILESVLKNKLGLGGSECVYARKCRIEEISTIDAKDFCEQNHLQGYKRSSVKLGLFHNDELVSVMTFSKHKDNYWELSRFCNKLGYSVIGGASKLLRYFENKFPWVKIISYADRRWSDGNMHYKLGFDFEKFNQPNYWYFKEHDINRMHRFALRKNPAESKGKTEWELRKSEGYNRIWDCGNYRFVKYKASI